MKNSKSIVECKYGFTLIELLVVISIIGTLAMMAFPLVGGAMMRGKRLKCSNNLKQWGSAITAYADEHNSRMPGLGTSGEGPANPTGNAKAWYNVLPPYLDNESMAVSVDKESVALPGSGDSIFVCPACVRPDTADEGQFFSSYAQNVWINRGVGKGKTLLSHQIPDPYSFVLFADNAVSDGSDAGRHQYAHMHARDMPGQKGVGAFRHGKFANILFADGHVLHHKIEQVYEEGMSEDDNFGYAMWNPNAEQVEQE